MNDRMKKLVTVLLLSLGAAAPAFAQLRLTITSGVTDPIAIAIVPFARAVPADGGLDVAQVIQRDLESTGRFKAMARTDMVFTPTSAAEVDSAGWKQQRVDYVTVGRVTALADGQIRIDAELVNVLTGQRVAGPNVTTAASNLRNAAHRIADALFEKIIGVRGAFATRIAYVSVDGTAPIGCASSRRRCPSCRRRGPRTVSGWPTFHSSGGSPPFTCNIGAVARKPWCPRAPASMARPRSLPTTRNWRSRCREATAISTSIFSSSRTASSRG
jgi:hypothetical protein